MKKTKTILTIMIILTIVSTMLAYKTSRIVGNIYTTTTTTIHGIVVTTYVRIPCNTLNFGLGVCTLTAQKYSFNGITYVPIICNCYAAPNAQ